MYAGRSVRLRRIDNEELRQFCDRVGLVVLNAETDGDPEASGTDRGTYIAECIDNGDTVGCCRIEWLSGIGICRLDYYLCKAYEYDEERFSDMIFTMLRALFAEQGMEKIACTHVKKIFGRQPFFREAGFVVEVLHACVNPNGERLVEEDYVMYREEFEKRYGDR